MDGTRQSGGGNGVKLVLAVGGVRLVLAGNGVKLVLAWGFVGIPLVWGVVQTLANALKAFH